MICMTTAEPVISPEISSFRKNCFTPQVTQAPLNDFHLTSIIIV